MSLFIHKSSKRERLEGAKRHKKNKLARKVRRLNRSR